MRFTVLQPLPCVARLGGGKTQPMRLAEGTTIIVAGRVRGASGPCVLFSTPVRAPEGNRQVWCATDPRLFAEACLPPMVFREEV